jgi:hypothetical protein
MGAPVWLNNVRLLNSDHGLEYFHRADFAEKKKRFLKMSTVSCWELNKARKIFFNVLTSAKKYLTQSSQRTLRK